MEKKKFKLGLVPKLIIAIIIGILLHRALAHSLKTRMGQGSIFFFA